MLTPPAFDALMRQIQSALPPSLKNLSQEAESKFKQTLQAKLSELDFVSREEFDVQTQVLLRTREKLNALEKRLDALMQGEQAIAQEQEIENLADTTDNSKESQ